MKKNILWLSRHQPSEVQKNQLTKALNKEIELNVVSCSINHGKEVIDLMNKYNCDEAVVVLPIDLISQIVEQGVKPIKAKMERTFNDNGKVDFIHSHFERIKKAEIITEAL